MYLHIGNNKNIRLKTVIGVFDLDTSSVSHITKEYLKECEKSGKTEYVTYDIPKSFVLTEDGGLHFSQISTATLKLRAEESEL